MANRRGEFWLLVISISVLIILVGCRPSGAGGSAEQTTDHPAFQRGMDWIDLGEFNNAWEEFDTVIEEEPKNVEARYQKARILLLQAKGSDAVFRRSRDVVTFRTLVQQIFSIEPNHGPTNSLLEQVTEKAERSLFNPDAEDRHQVFQTAVDLSAQGFISLDPGGVKQLMRSSPSSFYRAGSSTPPILHSGLALLAPSGPDAFFDGLEILSQSSDRDVRRHVWNLIQGWAFASDNERERIQSENDAIASAYGKDVRERYMAALRILLSAEDIENQIAQRGTDLLQCLQSDKALPCES